MTSQSKKTTGRIVFLTMCAVVLSLGSVGLAQEDGERLHFFMRSDSNVDGAVDMTDAIETLGALFLGGDDLLCEDAADTDDNGEVDISDAVATP